MRIAIGFAVLAGALILADGARAAPPALADHAALSRDLSAAAVEEVGRRARAKRYARRYDWTARPYWRPYQYRYWQFYYPHGGPLF